jgi:hypothetical protein
LLTAIKPGQQAAKPEQQYNGNYWNGFYF